MFTFPTTFFSTNAVVNLPVTTNLLLHLDSSNVSSITKDGSNLVSQWNDLSGLNNHVQQPNSSFRPTWTNAVQNNLDGIRWINANTGLRTTTNVAGRHCFVVLRHIESTTFGNFRRVIDRGDNTVGGAYAIFGNSGTTNYNPGAFDRNISTSNVWVNRNQTISALPINNTKLLEFITTTSTTAGILGIGTYFNADNINQSMLGYIFEVILYSDIKTASEITAISNYLNSKWAIYT